MLYSSVPEVLHSSLVLMKLICQRFGFVSLCWKCVGCCQVSTPVLIICRFKRIYEQSLSPCFVPVTKVTKTSAFSQQIIIKKIKKKNLCGYKLVQSGSHIYIHQEQLHFLSSQSLLRSGSVDSFSSVAAEVDNKCVIEKESCEGNNKRRKIVQFESTDWIIHSTEWNNPCNSFLLGEPCSAILLMFLKLVPKISWY